MGEKYAREITSYNAGFIVFFGKYSFTNGYIRLIVCRNAVKFPHFLNSLSKKEATSIASIS